MLISGLIRQKHLGCMLSFAINLEQQSPAERAKGPKNLNVNRPGFTGDY